MGKLQKQKIKTTMCI